MKKNKTYYIEYQFDGTGTSIVEADSPDEAIEKFENGEVIDDYENSTNYQIVKTYEKNGKRTAR